MNKKGQATSIYVFMLAIVVIILALAFAVPINQQTTSVMNETGEYGGMNCSGTTDNFVKAGCYVVDWGQAYFIGGLIAVAGIIIASRLIFE